MDDPSIWVSTTQLCRLCLKRTPKRESVIKRREWGGDYRFKCADDDLCEFTDISPNLWTEGGYPSRKEEGKEI